VVSGYGASAQTIDNAQSSTNSANDGVAADILILPAHSVNSELVYNGAVAASITVYRLDTPTITVNTPNAHVFAGQSLSLAPLFIANDAAGAGTLPIVQYAFYDVGNGGATNNAFLVNGNTQVAHSAGAAAVIVNAADLPSVHLHTAVGGNSSDTVYVSAFNGSYWGDWSPISVAESSTSYTSVELTSHVPYTVTTANLAITQSLGNGTVAYNQPSANFVITVSGSQAMVIDQVGSLGTDTLANVERLQFTDTMVALDTGYNQAGGGAYMLYQATFNRTPDAAGLGYWIAQLDSGKDIIKDVAAYFVSCPEFIAKYGANSSNASFVDNLYLNVLHRPGETGWVTYWNYQLDHNLISRAAVLELFATLPEGASLVANAISHGIAYQQWVG
jgi:hypothetical protein